MGEGFETLHLTLWDALFFPTQTVAKPHAEVKVVGVKGFTGGGREDCGLWHTIHLNPRPTVLSAKDASPHTRLAATAKSPNMKKASEGVSEVSALDDILILTHTQSHLKTQMARVTKV